MIVYESLGEPCTQQKIVPGATATGLGAEFITYTERTLPFTSGGTTTITVGDWIVGATSAAKAEVVAIILTSGTWAGGDAAGTFRIKNQHGTFQSENLKVAGGSNDATIAANSSIDMGDYPRKGMQAKSILVTVTAQTALADWDGSKPDQTALVGHSLVAGASVVIQDINAIRNFKIIDYANGSATTANVTFYF